MLWYYKEKKLIISLLVILLDGVILYFIPNFFNKINYFYPMLTISFLPFLCKNEKNSLITIFILGIIYDLLYSHIFLYHAIIFLVLAIINKRIIKYFNDSLFLYLFLAILNIVLYDSIIFLFIIISNYQVVSIMDLIYKISHSLLLNIMSVFVFHFMFKKRSINT